MFDEEEEEEVKKKTKRRSVFKVGPFFPQTKRKKEKKRGRFVFRVLDGSKKKGGILGVCVWVYYTQS